MGLENLGIGSEMSVIVFVNFRMAHEVLQDYAEVVCIDDNIIYGRNEESFRIVPNSPRSNFIEVNQIQCEA